MGYRQRPRPLGIAFHEDAYWSVDLANAECFMYFIAGLRQLFGDQDTLYVEGTALDPEAEDFYRSLPPSPVRVMPLLRASAKARGYHIPLAKGPHGRLSRLAASKTFRGLCDALLVYRDGRVLLDGARIGERRFLLSGEVKEAALKKFCSGKLQGEYVWVEPGPGLG